MTASGSSGAKGSQCNLCASNAADSGNDYAIFRSYINRLGRFSSPDPLAGSIADPESLNRYAYVLNDPCSLVDPLGLQDVVRQFSQIFVCNRSATDVIDALKQNFSYFANYSSGEGYAIFSPGALVPGGEILIDSTYRALPLNSVLTPLLATNTHAVTVSSVGQNSFAFETVKGRHPFYPGTVSFSARDVGRGQISFSVNVNANFSSLKYRAAFWLGGAQFEANIWTNLINNMADFCREGNSTQQTPSNTLAGGSGPGVTSPWGYFSRSSWEPGPPSGSWQLHWTAYVQFIVSIPNAKYF